MTGKFAAKTEQPRCVPSVKGRGIDPSMNYSVKTLAVIRYSKPEMARDDGGRFGRNSATCRYPACLPARAAGSICREIRTLSRRMSGPGAGGDHCRLLLFSPVASPRHPTARHPVASSSAVPGMSVQSTTWQSNNEREEKAPQAFWSSSSSASHGAKVCHISHSCRSTGPIPFGHGLASRSCQTRLSLTTSNPTAIRRAT